MRKIENLLRRITTGIILGFVVTLFLVFVVLPYIIAVTLPVWIGGVGAVVGAVIGAIHSLAKDD